LQSARTKKLEVNSQLDTQTERETHTSAVHCFGQLFDTDPEPQDTFSFSIGIFIIFTLENNCML